MKLLSTFGVVGVLRVAMPAWEAANGITVDASYGPTALMLERIGGGERADAAILTSAGVDRLIGEGVLAAGSRVDLARSLVGLAVTAGSPMPDLATEDAVKRALTGARSVAYSRKGQSGIFFAGLIERLGIASEVNARALILESGTTAKQVVSGRADIAVQQVSELMLESGVEIAPLPPELQDDLIFSGGVFTRAANATAAAGLLHDLADVRHASLYTAKGLQFAGLGRAG